MYVRVASTSKLAASHVRRVVRFGPGAAWVSPRAIHRPLTVARNPAPQSTNASGRHRSIRSAASPSSRGVWGRAFGRCPLRTAPRPPRWGRRRWPCRIRPSPQRVPGNGRLVGRPPAVEPFVHLLLLNLGQFRARVLIEINVPTSPDRQPCRFVELRADPMLFALVGDEITLVLVERCVAGKLIFERPAIGSPVVPAAVVTNADVPDHAIRTNENCGCRRVPGGPRCSRRVRARHAPRRLRNIRIQRVQGCGRNEHVVDRVRRGADRHDKIRMPAERVVRPRADRFQPGASVGPDPVAKHTPVGLPGQLAGEVAGGRPPRSSAPPRSSRWSELMSSLKYSTTTFDTPRAKTKTSHRCAPAGWRG